MRERRDTLEFDSLMLAGGGGAPRDGEEMLNSVLLQFMEHQQRRQQKRRRKHVLKAQQKALADAADTLKRWEADIAEHFERRLSDEVLSAVEREADALEALREEAEKLLQRQQRERGHLEAQAEGHRSALSAVAAKARRLRKGCEAAANSFEAELEASRASAEAALSRRVPPKQRAPMKLALPAAEPMQQQREAVRLRRRGARKGRAAPEGSAARGMRAATPPKRARSGKKYVPAFL